MPPSILGVSRSCVDPSWRRVKSTESSYLGHEGPAALTCHCNRVPTFCTNDAEFGPTTFRIKACVVCLVQERQT
jgi:hypothetical protein